MDDRIIVAFFKNLFYTSHNKVIQTLHCTGNIIVITITVNGLSFYVSRETTLIELMGMFGGKEKALKCTLKGNL